MLLSGCGATEGEESQEKQKSLEKEKLMQQLFNKDED